MNLSNSRAKCWLSCPKQHYYKYVLRRVPIKDSNHLTYGRAMHDGLESWYVAIKTGAKEVDVLGDMFSAIYAHAEEVDQLAMAALVAIMRGYHARYYEEDIVGWKTVGAERYFRYPEKNGNYRVGVVDLDIIIDSRPMIGEHKSTSYDISPGSTYREKLRRDPQVSEYLLAARHDNSGATSVLYNMIAKCPLKPAKATPEEKRKYKKDGTLYGNQREFDEEPEEFEERVALDIAKRPDRYYQRVEVTRTDDELDEHDENMDKLGRLMVVATMASLHPQNVGNCKEFGGCDYQPVCWDGISVYDESFYKEKEKR